MLTLTSLVEANRLYALCQKWIADRLSNKMDMEYKRMGIRVFEIDGKNVKTRRWFRRVVSGNLYLATP